MPKVEQLKNNKAEKLFQLDLILYICDVVLILQSVTLPSMILWLTGLVMRLIFLKDHKRQSLLFMDPEI